MSKEGGTGELKTDQPRRNNINNRLVKRTKYVEVARKIDLNAKPVDQL